VGSTVTQQAEEAERLTTGSAGLDTLLDGGFVHGGVYLVMGRPGTGKTTLCNQVAFTHAAQGRKVVYVTLLAETHARMLRNLQPFDFFRLDLVGSTLLYLGGYLVLRERRLAGLLQMLRQVLRDEQPHVLVIDGISTALSLGEAELQLKEFVAELQVLVDMSGCTALIAANMSSSEANGAEHSMVDGLIELTLQHSEQRSFREIEVLKFRGSDHYLGCHDLEISTGGLVVRPRTELRLARRARSAPLSEGRRHDTGIEQLDIMLGGGLLCGSVTMLLGFTGSGKTLFSMHFLEAGARRGERGLYFGFYESPERLIEAADNVGVPMRRRVDAGEISIVWQPPLRHGLDALAERLLAEVERNDVRRVVIDGLDGIRQSAVHTERSIRFVTALANELRARDVTVLITEETQKLFGPEVEVRIEGMSALVESIILLEYMDVGPELRRLLSIVKQRGSGYDTSVRELCIGDTGIVLAPDGSSARAIMLGQEKRRTKWPRLRAKRGGGAHGGGVRGRSQ
jgi:circadian clock protein KaiC